MSNASYAEWNFNEPRRDKLLMGEPIYDPVSKWHGSHNRYKQLHSFPETTTLGCNIQAKRQNPNSHLHTQKRDW